MLNTTNTTQDKRNFHNFYEKEKKSNLNLKIWITINPKQISIFITYCIYRYPPKGSTETLNRKIRITLGVKPNDKNRNANSYEPTLDVRSHSQLSNIYGQVRYIRDGEEESQKDCFTELIIYLQLLTKSQNCRQRFAWISWYHHYASNDARTPQRAVYYMIRLMQLDYKMSRYRHDAGMNAYSLICCCLFPSCILLVEWLLDSLERKQVYIVIILFKIWNFGMCSEYFMFYLKDVNQAVISLLEQLSFMKIRGLKKKRNVEGVPDCPQGLQYGDNSAQRNKMEGLTSFIAVEKRSDISLRDNVIGWNPISELHSYLCKLTKT